MKKTIYTLIILSIFLFIFLYPSESVSASKGGLLLWFNVIIPNLLPFMILSNLIIAFNAASYITFFFAPVLKLLFGISREGSYAVITGFLCGYPMGAKVTADLVTNQKISKSEGTFLLGFCNNVSPVFIINYVVYETFQSSALLKPVFLILYASPLLCAVLLRVLFYRHSFSDEKRFSLSSCYVNADFKMIDNAIMNGFETITKLGGYIILFAILSQMLVHLPPAHSFLKYWLISLTEITNGISVVASSALSFEKKFLIVLSCVSFGGISCVAQTQSMIKGSGLSIKSYLFAKVLNMGITAVLCTVYLFTR
ncbi:transporter [Konateibacter massiliensis]|uniref:transporter n=1 Tax=Konateibacter massiliensis TaxID=2002841 RepID=UPI000C1541F9|nr:transporter [Konateibacter massiliensis]